MEAALSSADRPGSEAASRFFVAPPPDPLPITEQHRSWKSLLHAAVEVMRKLVPDGRA